MNRRRLEAVLLVFVAGFLAYLIYAFRPGSRPVTGSMKETLPAPPGAGDAGQATTVLKGFDYTETVRGKPAFRIQAERTVGYGPAAGLLPNLYALEKVTLTVYPEQGAPVTANADRATYDHRTNEAHLSGNVRWIDGRGGLGETEEIAFAPSGRVLTAPGPVRLTRGSFILEGRSGIYDVGKREARLEGPIRGTGAGESTGGLTSITAGRALYKRDEETVELAGGVTGASKTGSRIAAESLFVKTRDEGRRFEWARAEGHVSGAIAGVSPPSAAASPRGAGSGGPRPPTSYAGDRAGLFFAEDGSVRSLSLSGSPATVTEPDRTLTASTVEVGFEQGRARSARATGSVRIESEKDRAQANAGSVTMNASGEIESLELTGAVHMESEGRKGEADKAVQVASRATWILTSDPGRSASVEGDGSKVSASRIEMDQLHKTVRAEGGARAVLTPKKDGARLASPVGDTSRPTFGKSDRMTFDDSSRLAVLEGNATLWQEGSSVNGQSITVSDAERTLAAVGDTRTVFAPAADSAAKPAPVKASGHGASNRAAGDRHPSVVTAKRLLYREAREPRDREARETAPVTPSVAAPAAGSSAHFEGSVTVTSGPWRASADQATAWIAPDRRLDRVELAGAVSFQDSQEGRSGNAEHATDWPREGRTVLEGKPAVVVDRGGNRVAGATLTISNRGGSVEITAPEGGRTETIHRTGTDTHQRE